MSTRRDQEFTDYVTARSQSLRRLAYLLCQNPSWVDDLVQAAFARLYAHWGRASSVEHLDAYVRTILVRVYLKDQRSGWSTRVELSGQPPERVAIEPDQDAALDMRAALAALPRRQRATLVLRFYCDLSVEQTARMLGCSPGTVKSQTAKGLEAMRRGLGEGPRADPAAIGHPSEPVPAPAPMEVHNDG